MSLHCLKPNKGLSRAPPTEFKSLTWSTRLCMNWLLHLLLQSHERPVSGSASVSFLPRACSHAGLSPQNTCPDHSAWPASPRPSGLASRVFLSEPTPRPLGRVRCPCPADSPNFSVVLIITVNKQLANRMSFLFVCLVKS